MDLHITKIRTSSTTEYNLPYEWLEDKAVHMFIACNDWDTLTVELSDDIPEGVLKYIVLRCKDIHVITPGYVTDKMVNLLCELYQDKAGAIRKAHMLGRNPVSVL